MRIGYLVSQYPAISHSFILREVLELRRLGWDLRVASINSADRPTTLLTTAERQEQSSCFYLKKSALRRLWGDLLRTLVRYPARFVVALLFACRLSGLSPQRLAKHLCYLLEAVVLAGWMTESKLTHLHVHFATPAATVALFASKLLPIEFSLTVHGPDEFDNVKDHLLSQKCLDSRFLCVISHFASSQLMKCMTAEQWPKLAVIPLGVDPAIFRPRQRPASNLRFQILCVGRLVAAKGQYVLLEALAGLLAEGRNLSVVLVGDGPQRPALESFVQRRQLTSYVQFTGSINQEHIREFYSSADLFVLPSFAEGVPVVLMEAMAMEIPCVSTWVAGIPELIRDGCDGLLVPPGSVTALHSAVGLLMDNQALRHSLAEAGRRRVIEKYDLTNNVSKLGKLFEERVRRAA